MTVTVTVVPRRRRHGPHTVRPGFGSALRRDSRLAVVRRRALQVVLARRAVHVGILVAFTVAAA